MTAKPPPSSPDELPSQVEADEEAQMAPVIASLSAELGRYLAQRIHYNLERYPDITDSADPRLMEPPEPTPRAPRWVYFMADYGSDLIKIGVSVDAKVRMPAVARTVGRKLALAGTVRGDYGTEAAFHKLLAVHRAHGEWFRRGRWYDEVLAGLDAREDAEALMKRIVATEGRDG